MYIYICIYIYVYIYIYIYIYIYMYVLGECTQRGDVQVVFHLGVSILAGMYQEDKRPGINIMCWE